MLPRVSRPNYISGRILAKFNKHVASKKTGNPRGRPVGSFTSGSADMQVFSLLHRGQARIYRRMQLSLLNRINAQMDADPMYVVSDADRKELSELDNFLNKASAGITKIIDSAMRVNDSLTTEQLEAQLRSEFVRAANSWSDREWAVVDEVRAQRDARKAANG